ncbi:MAG: hypothetical protein AAGF84_02055 [Planctomycetota bacterium]
MTRPRRASQRPKAKPKQAGKAIRKLLGDSGQILFPDRGARPLQVRVQKFHNTARDGHGSHHGGKHKLG